MNPESQNNMINASVGVGGTVIAILTPEKAAIFAGVATGVWMSWQVAVSIWDRLRRKEK